jgi:sortase A
MPSPWISWLLMAVGLFVLGLALIVKTARREKILFLGLGLWLLLVAAILSPPAMRWLRPPVAVNPRPVAENSRQEGQPAPTDEAVQIIWPSGLPTEQAIETLPDYPIPTPQVTITPGKDGNLPDTSAVQRILIPALGLDTMVKYVPFDGETWLIAGLQNEVAWMGNTSWPGLDGNTGLAGHVTLRNGADGPFRYLENLKAGDEITLFTEKNIYRYRVTELEVVEQTDLSVIQPADRKELTLITCTDWDAYAKSYLKRLAVLADLDAVQPKADSVQGN